MDISDDLRELQIEVSVLRREVTILNAWLNREADRANSLSEQLLKISAEMNARRGDSK